MKTHNNVHIYSLNNEAAGICKIEGKVAFVPFALSDEVIDIEITDTHKKYDIGKIKKISKESCNRKKVECPYYYNCGGCDLMHSTYEAELQFKKGKVINNLYHIANIKIDDLNIIYDKNFYYRNHIILSVNKNVIGFYKNKTNEIVDIKSCIISNEVINDKIKEIRVFISKYIDNGIKRISIKSYSEVLINIIGDFKLIDEFLKYVKCDSLYINNKHVFGKKNVTENIKNFSYNISAMSFFQKNTAMTEKLYTYVKTLINNNSNVLDLYCGTGTIGIFIADICKSVIGIEEIEDAIKDANINKIENNVQNIEFINSRVEEVIDRFKNIDTIIVDPPRTGLSKSTINSIIDIKSKKIIYISCDSTTLARDINILKEYYEIKSIKLFDLFPNTHHVECVVELKIKEDI